MLHASSTFGAPVCRGGHDASQPTWFRPVPCILISIKKPPSRKKIVSREIPTSVTSGDPPSCFTLFS